MVKISKLFVMTVTVVTAFGCAQPRSAATLQPDDRSTGTGQRSLSSWLGAKRATSGVE